MSGKYFYDHPSITYEDSLLNILLLKLRPGYERKTCKMISKILSDYNESHESVSKAYCRTKNIKMPDDNRVVIPSNRDLATYGRFSVAKIFQSYGFGISENLSVIENVLSQQHIVGAVPKLKDEAFKSLVHVQQDVNKIIGGDQYIKPFTAIIQMQIVSLFTIAFNGALIPAILKLIDDKAKTLLANQNGADIDILFIKSFGWSDHCLLIRGSNMNIIRDFVLQIRGITIGEIRDQVFTCEPLKCCQNVLDAIRNIGEVVEKLRKLNAQSKGQSDVEALHDVGFNHVYSNSYTVLGMDFDMVDNGIRYFDLCLNSDSRFKEEKYEVEKKFAKWQVKGENIGNTRIKVKPGHEVYVKRKLNCQKEDFDMGVRGVLCDLECNKIIQNILKEYQNKQKYLLFGHFDVLLSWYIFDDNKNIHWYDTKYFIGATYYLRWKLLNEPGSVGPGKNSPWYDDDTQSDSRSQSLKEYTTEIESLEKETDKKQGEEVPRVENLIPISTFLENVLKKQKILVKNEQRKEQLKEKQVSRNIWQAESYATRLWFDNLLDPLLFSQMIELYEFFIIKIAILENKLADNTVTEFELERTINTFNSAFSKAMHQRLLSSYNISEFNDIITEYRGGMAKIVTSLDGLVKNSLSVGFKTQDVGLLTLIQQKLNASIEEYNHPIEESCKVGAILHLNKTHLIHPFRITEVLHEIFHVIIASDDFLTSILPKNRQGSQAPVELEVLKSIQNSNIIDDPKNFIRNRLKEMTVEYFLLSIVFFNNPKLHCRVYLSKCALSKCVSGIDDEPRLFLLSEHALRCFFVYYTFFTKGFSNDCRKRTVIEKTFRQWWQDNSRYLANKKDCATVADRLPYALSIWIEQGIIEKMTSVYHAFGIYFSNPERQNFQSCLHDNLNEELLEDVMGRLLKEKEIQRGNVNIFEVDQGIVTDKVRARKMNGFIKNIILVRAYHEIIDSWIGDKTSEVVIAQRSEITSLGKENEDYAPIILDKSWGSIFILEPELINRFLLLRISWVESMWYIAEESKCELVNSILD